MPGTVTRHTVHEGTTRGAGTRGWDGEIHRVMRFSNTVSKIEARTENKIIIRQPAAPPSGRMLTRGSPFLSAPFDGTQLAKNFFGSAPGTRSSIDITQQEIPLV
jgi:hypothetical protein